MIDPAIPLWTKNQKGMVGGELSQGAIDKATTESLKMRDQMMTFVQYLISIGVHKQDANRYLEPWMRVAVIITGTEWDGFYKLRNHPHAQPDFQEYAAEMERLDKATLSNPISLGEWYKPWPDLNLAANVCKAASVSYANHANDRNDEDYLRIHDDLINADPRHSSPAEHCAMAVEAGMYFEDIEMPFQVFDPLAPYDSVYACDDGENSVYACDDGENHTLISTANFSGFLQYRKILETGLKVDVNTGLIL